MANFIHFFSKKDIVIGTSAFVLGGGVSLWMNTSIIAALGSAMLLTGGSLAIVYVTRLKQMLNVMKSVYKFEAMCCAIQESDQPHRLIAEVFGPLSADKKLKLLNHLLERQTPITHLDWLLSNPKKNRLILESLLKGLSSKQRLAAIRRLYHDSNFLTIFLIIWEQVPTVLELLFCNMQSGDKLDFLIMPQDGDSYKGDKARPVFMLFMDNAINTFYFNRDHPSRDVSLVGLIDFLFKGLSIEQLKPLLAPKGSVKLCDDKFEWKWYELTPLELVTRIKSDKLTNLLVQYGALEVDAESISAVLALGPKINITPYRNRLKSRIKETECLKTDVVEDLICDYLISKTASL